MLNQRHFEESGDDIQGSGRDDAHESKLAVERKRRATIVYVLFLRENNTRYQDSRFHASHLKLLAT
jgi:hypothetical protein